MTITRDITFTAFSENFTDKLLFYLENLNPDSKQRFGPHAYTLQAIHEKFNDPGQFKMFIAIHTETKRIVAYTIAKFGWLEFDANRLLCHGLKPEVSDCTVAPSVADHWQGKGLGTAFFNHIIDRLKQDHQVNRIILWGGVQADNTKALDFYNKLGFRELGSFDHKGKNFDMILNL